MKSLQERDTFLGLSVLVVVAATLKFLLEGVAIEIAGKWVSMGHVDPLTYGALLSPVLAAHGYMKVRKQVKPPLGEKVDNPDVR